MACWITKRRYDHARRTTSPIGKNVAGRPASTTAMELRATLDTSRPPECLSAPSAGKPTPCCRGALAEFRCPLIRTTVPLGTTFAVSLRTCSASGRSSRSERESITTATGRLSGMTGRAPPWPLVWRQRCSARRRSESVGHPPGRRPASGIDDVLGKRVRRAETLRRHVARQAGQLGRCRNGRECVRRLLADSLNHLTVPVAIAAPSHP